MRVVVMGSGTSLGVPTIGCECAVCRSPNPRNKRTRASVLVEYGERNILIDTATDLRSQAIREGINRVDAVLYTHAHADHILGLDDLRPFNWRIQKHIPVFGNAQTIHSICNTFSYVFSEPQPGGSMPRITPETIDGAFELEGVPLLPFAIWHGKLSILGYRIGDFSYITDCSDIPEESYSALRGTRVLILGVLGYKPHPTHLHLEKALRIVDRVRPDQTYFTHISHAFDHEHANAELPPEIQLAYDGLRIEMDER